MKRAAQQDVFKYIERAAEFQTQQCAEATRSGEFTSPAVVATKGFWGAEFKLDEWTLII